MMTYLNSTLLDTSPLSIQDYHIDTPVAEYDLVGARSACPIPHHLENSHEAI
jgi:hypothetical protein